MILVPEEMYRGMLSSSESLGDTARVFAAKQEVSKVLRSRKKAGIKRVLYNKKMRDFLKTRQEVVDKPVRVEITGTPAAPTPKARLQRNRKRKEAGPTPKRARRAAPQAENEGVEGGPEEQVPSLNAQHQETPKTHRQRVISSREQEVKDSINEHIKKVMDYVNENRARFGVSDDGRILGPTKTEVRNSSIDEAIQSLVQPVYKAGGSPPGTSYIRSRLMRDPQAQTLIKRATENARFQLGMGHTTPRPSFKPTLWKRS